MLIQVSNHVERDSLVAKAMLKASGGEYDLPWPLPNMKASDEAEFWSWRSSQDFRAEVWLGQKLIGGTPEAKPVWGTIMVYWIDSGRFIDGGFAVAHEYRYPGPSPVHYFSWRACEHEFKHENVGRCLNRYTCAKCTRSYEIDSSD